MAQIGFIGLGNMGLPMAANLVKGGHAVTGFDTVPAALEKAEGEWHRHRRHRLAKPRASKDVIITMLPSGPIVLAVLGEIITAARPGALVIDSSTIDVASAREAHRQAKAAGLEFIDAPVSGGVGGAEAGTLTFMAGGTPRGLRQGEAGT